jgi:hypothetical protein
MGANECPYSSLPVTLDRRLNSHRGVPAVRNDCRSGHRRVSSLRIGRNRAVQDFRLTRTAPDQLLAADRFRLASYGRLVLQRNQWCGTSGQ